MTSTRHDPPRLSALGLAYVAVTFLGLVAVILVIWPTSTGGPWWVRSMSDETRFLAIAASGGALGCAFKATLAIARAADTPWEHSRQILNLLVSVQVAVIAYLLIRSFVVLPTTPVSGLSPFGVLFVGLGTGWVADELFARAKRLAAADVGAELGSRIDLIANAVGAATLDNYKGKLCVEILDGEGRKVPIGLDKAPLSQPSASPSPESSPRAFLLRSNQIHTLQAWFESGNTEAQASEEVLITGGNDVAEVSFVVAADSSADVRFTPGRQVFSFDPRQPSKRLQFQFVAPVLEVPFRLWLRATQKGRLVTVLAVEASPDSPI